MQIEKRKKMRRSDREIKDFNAILEVIKQCDVCRLALNDDGYPYILPLNFGVQVEDGKVVLYFHGAAEGTKYKLIEKDNRVAFEMDCSHKLVMEQSGDVCSCTMEYQSVIGKGRIEMVSDEQRQEALEILMRHYHEEACRFNSAVASHTAVFRLVVSELTGKVHRKRADK